MDMPLIMNRLDILTFGDDTPQGATLKCTPEFLSSFLEGGESFIYGRCACHTVLHCLAAKKKRVQEVQLKPEVNSKAVSKCHSPRSTAIAT